MTRIHASATEAARGYAAGSQELTLSDRSFMTKLLVRAGQDTVAARQLAVSFGASRHSEEILICGQRPDEWLLLGAAAPVARFADSLTTTGHVSLIDHTHSRALFRLTGTSAPSVLAKLCSLDWDDDMTPDGAVVSAPVAKTDCDIIRSDVSAGGATDGAGDRRSYLVACDRSFGQYLFDVILDAGREFRLSVAP